MAYIHSVEELPKDRQLMCYQKGNELGRSVEWLGQALSHKPLEDWLTFGFNLMSKPNFIKQVDAEMSAKDDITVNKVYEMLMNIEKRVTQIELKLQRMTVPTTTTGEEVSQVWKDLQQMERQIGGRV